jgi:molybdopterin converting factor small subunit
VSDGYGRIIAYASGSDGQLALEGRKSKRGLLLREGRSLCYSPGTLVRASCPREGGAVSIKIHVPAVLRASCGGVRELSLSASSVRAALEQLERSHAALYRSVCDETGAVRRHVNLFVNAWDVRDREGLDTVLVSGDVLTILPSVSGG